MLSKPEVESSDAIIRGMILVYHQLTLLYLIWIHLFLCVYFLYCTIRFILGLIIHAITLSTSVSDSLVVDWVFRSYFYDCLRDNTQADLIVLDMGNLI